MVPGERAISMVPLVAIVGPTAVGKSALALHLARTFDGEVVNADSRQVYRFLDIGTAKPSAEDRARVPHHLIDIIDPDEEFSLALFLELAHRAIEHIRGRAKLPIVVGGTGQYVWALLEGWHVPRVPPNPRLRADMEVVARRDGPQALHETLRDLDPEAASRIDHRNVRRVIRALEVYDAIGAAPTDPRRQPCSGASLVIGLTAGRETLYEQIDQRVDGMLESGLVEEVRQLLRLGYSADLPSMSSMGYKEISLYLKGELSLEEASRRIKYATHRLARRQYSWFRRNDPRIHWLELGGDVNRRAEALARDSLGAVVTCGKIGSTAEESSG